MNHTEFAVSRFENRNGVTSWRVDGRIHGLRIRKNFKTREEAAAEQAALELKSLQVASRLRPVMSSLTEDQVREAPPRQVDPDTTTRENRHGDVAGDN